MKVDISGYGYTAHSKDNRKTTLARSSSSYSHPGVVPDGVSTNAQFTPLVWVIDPGIDPADYSIRFEYSESNPNAVEVIEHGEAPYTWIEYKLPEDGRLRLWTADGHQRSANPVDQEGHFIASGATYNLTNVPSTIYVEAVRPSLTVGGDTIKATLTYTPTGHSCEAELVLTAAEIEVHDLRHWGPRADNDFGQP